MNARDSNPGPAGRDESLADRAEIVLLTVDGADFRRVGVDALDGVVTLSGEVKTESEKKQAAAVVRRVSGVHDVNNQLQVAHAWLACPPSQGLKAQVEAALKSDQAFKGVKVESVGDGVVRISGMSPWRSVTPRPRGGF
jgi:metal-sulfur cluster biosynthetic enzyme